MGEVPEIRSKQGNYRDLMLLFKSFDAVGQAFDDEIELQGTFEGRERKKERCVLKIMLFQSCVRRRYKQLKNEETSPSTKLNLMKKRSKEDDDDPQQVGCGGWGSCEGPILQ